jgi:hypothetical protein
MVAFGYFEESKKPSFREGVKYLKENKLDGVTSPYIYLGEVEYMRHEWNMPISFVWRLKEEMLVGMIRVANKSIV